MIHGKQFAILGSPIEMDGYLHRTLPDGRVLSWHRDLPVTVREDGEAMLFGHAWNAYEQGSAPGDLVMSAGDVKEILQAEQTWCGRYVLIIQGMVYTDLTASLCVFYADEGISSDISFLEKAGSHPRNDLKLADKTKWYPGPATAFEGISRLLPSQVYDYRAGKVHFRNPLGSWTPEGKSPQEIRELFCKTLASSCVNMHSHYNGANILVALTGGYDSRLSFAALSSLGSAYPFSAYTLEHDQISREDREYPPQLCNAVHVPLYYGKRDRTQYSGERDQAYQEHLSGMVVEEDQKFYAYRQYDQMVPPDQTAVLIRSNIFPLAAVSVSQQRAVGKQVNLSDFCANYEISQDSPMARAFTAFFQWIHDNPVQIPDTHRFYWEQKLACWSAENDRGYDIYENLIPIQMGNCRDLAAMLLSLPEEDRKGKKHQAEMTAMLCPEIADIPYGSGGSQAAGAAGKALEAVEKAWRKMRKIGIGRTFRYYINKIFKGKQQEG